MHGTSQGPLKPRLLELIQQAQVEQQAFVAQLSADERAAYGAADAWSAKDHIAHISAWLNDATRIISAAVRGETPEKSPSDTDVNPQIFAAHQHQSWDEVQSEAAQAGFALVAAMEACSEADLSEPDRFAWRAGNPLWVEAFISGFQHPGEHYEQFYIESGETSRATSLRERYLATARRLFGGTAMFGYMLYNTAWFYVNNGQPDLALDQLGEAVAIVPALREWGRQDPALAPLHDNPAFQALVVDDARPVSA